MTLKIFVVPFEDGMAYAATAVLVQQACLVARLFVRMGWTAVCMFLQQTLHLQVAVQSSSYALTSVHRPELVVAMVVVGTQLVGVLGSCSSDSRDKAAHGAAGYVQMSVSLSSVQSVSADEVGTAVYRPACPQEASEGSRAAVVARTAQVVQ